MAASEENTVGSSSFLSFAVYSFPLSSFISKNNRHAHKSSGINFKL